MATFAKGSPDADYGRYRSLIPWLLGGRSMFRYLTLATCVALASTALHADNKEQARLQQVGVVMQQVLDVPDDIPQQLLENTECVIVIPSMTKIAIGTLLRPDADAASAVYGRRQTARANVAGTPPIAVPESGRHFVDGLDKGTPRNESKRT